MTRNGISDYLDNTPIDSEKIGPHFVIQNYNFGLIFKQRMCMGNLMLLMLFLR